MTSSARIVLTLLVALAPVPCPSRAQSRIVPLPPVESPPVESPPVESRVPWAPSRTVSHPDSPAELPQPFFDAPRLQPRRQPALYRDLPDAISPNGVVQGPCFDEPNCDVPLAAARNPDLPPDARDGMFQKLIFTSAYIEPGNSGGLGIVELDLRTILALPIPSRKAPLLITPGFGTYILDWPQSPDLPSQLYDAYVQFRWMCRWSPALATDFAITPGVYSDFEQGADDAFRLPGHGALVWTWAPQWKAVAGLAYLDRVETNYLPIGGLIWTPNEDVKYEMVFPKPKLAHRLRWRGASTEETQDWVYLGGEFGGSAWAIHRADGTTDMVDYRDWRLLLGIERKAIGRLDYRLEIGYLFDRRFLYQSSPIEYNPDDTLMVRLGATY